MRVRAAAASSRISAVKPCAVSAAAARSRRWAGAGSANSVAGIVLVMVSLSFLWLAWGVLLSSTTTRPAGTSGEDRSAGQLTLLIFQTPTAAATATTAVAPNRAG